MQNLSEILIAPKTDAKTPYGVIGKPSVGGASIFQTMKEIPLTQGKVALVDDEDYDWLNQWKWYAAKTPTTYYATRGYFKQGKRHGVVMHRLILNVPSGLGTDHKDRNGLNNQRSNLRIATIRQNSRNRKRNNGKRYIGVFFKSGKYEASLTTDCKTYYLGRFVSEIEAAKAYDEMAKKMYGEFANLNFK